MNIFSFIIHWFQHVFGAHGENVKKVLEEAAPYVAEAAPIVQDVDLFLKAVEPSDQSGVVAALEKFLSKYEADAEKVAGAVTSLSALPLTDLWHAAAVTALGFILPQGTALSVLNLAVELAYNIAKKVAAAKAGGTAGTVLNPVPVP